MWSSCSTWCGDVDPGGGCPQTRSPRIPPAGNSTDNCGVGREWVRYSGTVNPEQIIGLVLALLLMGAGLAGSILPGLPGTPLVLIAAIAHKLYFGAHGVGWLVMTLLAGLMAVSIAMDYAASVYGAHKLGATWRGATGAIVGGLIGLFFNLPGLLLGPFVGALLFELAGGRNLKESSRAGVGATLGLLAGTLGKLACCLAMMFLFTADIIWRAVQS